MSTVIKKAKLYNDKFLEIEFENVERQKDDSFVTDQFKLTAGHIVHDDLLKSFAALKPHVITLCELDEWENVVGQEEKLFKYSCTGFTIGGSNEHEGVTLIGRKTLSSKKVLNLITPFTKYDMETTDYEYSEELRIAVLNACAEVIAYLDGKHAPNPQLELELKQ